MKKVVKIGSVSLDFPLVWREQLAAVGNVATARRTIAGTTVVYEQKNRTTSLNVSLDSLSNGWQAEETVTALIALADGAVGGSVTVEFSDGTSVPARFSYEAKGGAVQANALYEGAKWYRVKIYMARV